jgi:4-hydroxyphenylacetate 3-monooxygenase
MLVTGDEYRESLRDGRQVWINGEKVNDVPTHRAFKPIVDVRARIYDMAHEDKNRDVMSYEVDGTNERNCIGHKLPKIRQDWEDKRQAIDAVMKDIGGVVTRMSDETVGELWSLYDGRDVLKEVDPRFSENIAGHIDLVVQNDSFHVSANTDPKGDRSKRPQDKILICCYTSLRKPMPALSCVVPNTRPPHLIPIRPSSNQPLLIGEMPNFQTMQWASYAQ